MLPPFARSLRNAVLPAAIVLAAALPARAQEPAIYVAGAALADIKQFDSVESTQLPLGILGDASQNATAAGGGIRIGTFLHPRWSLELGVDAESRTSTRVEYNLPGLPRTALLDLLQLTNSTRFLTVSTTIGFHPRRIGRLRLGYRGGVSLVRGTYGSTLSTPTFDFADFAFAFADISIGGISIPGDVRFLPQPSSTSVERTDNAVGGLLGIEAAVDLTSRLAAVPALRVIAFSNNSQGVFLIRPEIGVRWAF